MKKNEAVVWMADGMFLTESEEYREPMVTRADGTHGRPRREDLKPFQFSSILVKAGKLLASVQDGLAVAKGGVLYWTSNGNPIPPHVFEEAGFECPAAQKAAADAHGAEFIRAYRAAQEGRERTPEELAEMRAEFGAGATVVDVFTGRKIRL